MNVYLHNKRKIIDLLIRQNLKKSAIISKGFMALFCSTIFYLIIYYFLYSDIIRFIFYNGVLNIKYFILTEL